VKPRAIKDPALEGALFRRRAWLAFALVMVALLVLGARFAWLQVHRHAEFELRSEENRVRLRPLAPARGLIYDRNGVLLAENVPQYRLELVPEQVGDVDAAVARLAELLDLGEDEVRRFHEERRARRRFENIPLKFLLSEEEIARFAVHRHEFPGVEVVPYLTRYYPQGELFAHVVGYVGRIDREDRQRLDPRLYAGSTHIGKTGIERHYEARLIGVSGYERVETNAQGRALRVLSRRAPTQGEHLYLTLDARLQAAAIAAFGGQSGAAVAIDPRNGEVLALVSTPGFDPNLFVNGISRADYQALTEAVERPLFNRALSGAYEPGSTMKPFVALAGLELGAIRPETRIWSSGEFSLPGLPQVWRDHRAGGHGHVDLNEAMAQSVNTYFYQLAVQIGINRLSAELAAFGFGAPTGIDLAGESAGVLPSREWKRRVRNQNWFPGETVLAGIGQGYWVVTPIQLAHATATLAIDGVPRPPHLLRAVQSRLGGELEPVPTPPAGAPVVSNRAYLEAVHRSMLAVMHGPTGTARASAFGAPYRIAAKTGTAQRVRRREPSAGSGPLPLHLRHRASFVAFAPAEAPTIALAVIVEQAESGSRSAAPVARRILDAWLVPGAAEAIIEGRYVLDQPPPAPTPTPTPIDAGDDAALGDGRTPGPAPAEEDPAAVDGSEAGERGEGTDAGDSENPPPPAEGMR
jgi:penicillin-binding protein 2